MKAGKTIPALIAEVKNQSLAKRDLVANTSGIVRMSLAQDYGNGVALDLLAPGAEALERFELSDTAHRQIAQWLQIPWTYYGRLLNDHRDLVVHQVNALFEREPGDRLLRTFKASDSRRGVVRAFLSNRYKPLDNDLVLARALPKMLNREGSLPETHVLSSEITDNHLYMKVLFTDDSLKQTIGKVHGTDRDDDVRPGFILRNSETGHGSLSVRGFFYRSFCTNGAVWGMTDATVEFTRSHLGGKLVAGQNMEVFSDDTRRKDDEAIVAALGDVMASLAKPEFVQAMGDQLRRIKGTAPVKNASAAVEVVAKDLGLVQSELDAMLENFIADRDYSQWGMLNAVTAVANRDDVSYERACELELLAPKIANFTAAQWQKVVEAERVPAKAA